MEQKLHEVGRADWECSEGPLPFQESVGGWGKLRGEIR